MNDRSLRIAPAIVLLLALGACASTPPDRIAKNTLDIIKVSAETAMKVHADLYNKGLTGNTQEVRDARRAKVDAAYEAVRASCVAASMGLAAVVTWQDMVALLSKPQADLSELTKLVPEARSAPKEK